MKRVKLTEKSYFLLIFQKVFTCPKLATETLDHDLKSAQSQIVETFE